MRLARFTKKLGMLEVGNASDGSALYLAESDEDTSGFYPVGADAYGNTLYSTNPNATVDMGLSNSIANIVGSLTSVYQAKTLNDINAQRLRSGQSPLSQAQSTTLTTRANTGMLPATQQLLIYAGIVGLIFYALSKSHK